MAAILRYVLMAAVAVFLTRWLRKALSGSGGGKSPKPSPWPGSRETSTSPRSKLKVLRFRTDPLEVRGLDSAATDQDIRQAYEQAMDENDPAKVADMATEIRELAARRQREVQAAYSQLCSEE